MADQEMPLQNHPEIQEAVSACMDAASKCAQMCTSCADACLAKEEVAELRRCIRLDMDCADVCETTVRVLARQTETDWQLLRSQVLVCKDFCAVCSNECARHAHDHEHCRVCGSACEDCVEACSDLLALIDANDLA